MNSPLRVIVIEDDYLLAGALVDVLVRLGYEVQRTAATVRDALRLIESWSFDLAVVDLDLNGKMAVAVLDRLRELGVPFLLATGTFVDEIPARYRSAPRVSKPYDMHGLRCGLDMLKTSTMSLTDPDTAPRR